MGRSRKTVTYAFLAVCLALIGISQVTYTADVIRLMAGTYPQKPFYLGPPWPTVVDPAGAALQAGLRPGDRVIAIDGRKPRGLLGFARAVRAHAAGTPITVSVQRGGRSLDFNVTVPGARDPWWFALITYLFLPWLSIALGFWVAAMRPYDVRAWLVFGVLVCLSQVPRSFTADPLGWPPGLGLTATAVREAALPAWGICMLLFGFYFPQRWSFDQKRPWFKWVFILPLLALTVWDPLRSIVRAVDYSTYEGWPHLPDWVSILFLFTSISFFFVGISVKYSNPAIKADDRRRLRVLYWGCTAAMGPLFLLDIYSAVFRRANGDDGGPLIAFALMMLALFPVTMTYVIVVQRALDVRMVIRQGVQYALAHRGIRVMQLLLTAAVVILVVTMAASPDVNRPRRITLIAGAIAIAAFISKQADRLRRWVDRRFFREAYDAEQILGDLSDQVRTILEKNTLLETVARRISESLHVERMAVLLRDGGSFRPALVTGYSGPLEFTVSTASEPIMELARSREPTAVDGNAPGELARLGAQLLLPLASSKELLGFISLGPKKSEAPYSSSDTRLLRTVAAQTGLALENSRLSEAIAAETAQRELLSREIEIAREVQQRLFPQRLPQVPGLQYAGYCRPARGVGGDYYDFLELPGGRLGTAIADVSGKGVPAALLMASLQASVRGQSQSRPGEVAALMASVNRLVYDASPANRYATFCYAEFDPARRRLVYTNGGHNPPILLRSGEIIRLEAGGPVVGLFPSAEFVQDEVQLQPGDLLVLFTDGISEAQNAGDEEWGEEALIEIARSCRMLAPAAIIEAILSAADTFAAGAQQYDDMTLVVARVEEENK